LVVEPGMQFTSHRGCSSRRRIGSIPASGAMIDGGGVGVPNKSLRPQNSPRAIEPSSHRAIEPSSRASHSSSFSCAAPCPFSHVLTGAHSSPSRPSAGCCGMMGSPSLAIGQCARCPCRVSGPGCAVSGPKAARVNKPSGAVEPRDVVASRGGRRLADRRTGASDDSGRGHAA